MCQECGCGKPGQPYSLDSQPAGVTGEGGPAATHHHEHTHEHEHPHSHGPGKEHSHPHAHSHAHDHTHAAGGTGEPDHAHDPLHPPEAPHEHQHPNAPPAGAPHRVVDVNQAVLSLNDRMAERNRGFFSACGVLVLNVLSSPGSGKTTLIQKTIERLGSRLRLGVIVGDLATDNDAARLRATGAPVVQINTGTVCHLEAEMVARALSRIDARSLDVLIIENVGNLVCPASFDLGERQRVVLTSVTEGEDKPLKYPPMFHAAQVTVVTKSDLAAATGFDRETALANLRRVAHHAQIFELSARTGEGMDAWCRWLETARAAVPAP